MQEQLRKMSFKDFSERCLDFTVAVYKHLKKYNYNSSARPYINQLCRASSSVGANISESKNAESDKEFKRYYEIALRSANETIYWMKFFRRINEVEENESEYLMKEIDEITRIIAASVITMRRKQDVKK